ncbi:hypothetical protein [Caballeronia grimmiae]|uniref:Galactosyl transferase GMA12/MNN10 domain protein n=1 Tax=Caballeronia grimmiae TaxID=1071679 RepID=A0A069P9V5_9BURK|nr:hypothetical protein [Caballeronia grimmiae]KDR36619.1 hypothetical protein BG57_17475 [Caballeronia grimmiae]GGD54424.1 hypothetical protein GCM10010985_05270 [Caballeronia grimmiae]
MTTHVISFFADDNARASLENHRRYCARNGYQHEFVDASAIGWPQLRMILKYQVLLRTLRACAEGDLVLLLTQDALLIGDIRCESLMQYRRSDWVVALDAPGDAAYVMASFQLWRNTEAARDRAKLLSDGPKLGRPPVSESDLLRLLEPEPFNVGYGGLLAVAPAGLHASLSWLEWPILALALVDLPEAPRNYPVFTKLRDLLAGHINDCQAKGLPYLTLPPSQSCGSVTAYEVINPDAPIALAMLYTPNVREYGEIAERNLKRYCARHGYGLHIYRDVPAQTNSAAAGNWFKPWVLLRHLPQHQWLFWIDADVLVIDQKIPLESLLQNRDRVLATDISWLLNSGIMGFRNTHENLQVLHEVERAMSAIVDKSSVQSNGGDQDVFIKVMQRYGMAAEDDLFDCTMLNTPYQLQTPTSFMVHYMGMWPQLRALVMHHGDEMCRGLDTSGL